MIITKDEIEKIVLRLAPKTFYNEKQFQFDLAWELNKYFVSLQRNCKIHLEYRSKLNNHYYDIVLEENGEFCPIELKHKTKTHMAQDLGRYDYLKDVERIKNFANDNPDCCFDNGFAIFLTEDHVYWDKDGAKCNYRDFSLKDKFPIQIGTKQWHTKTPLTKHQLVAKYGSRAVSIDIKQHYDIDWVDYCSGYKFLLLEIK